jgi:hypothetical protein
MELLQEHEDTLGLLPASLWIGLPTSSSKYSEESDEITTKI